MKILHLNPELNITCGVSRIIYSIMSFSNEKLNQSVMCFGGDAVGKFRNSGLSVEQLSVKRGLFRFPYLVFFLFMYCKKNDVNIIHSHHRGMDLGAWIVSHFIKLSTITNVHSKVTGKRRLSYLADKIITCGETIKNHLVDYFIIDPEKIEVINNFVNPTDYSYEHDSGKIKNSLGITESDKVLLFVGRIHKEKGSDILVKSFEIVAEKEQNTVLVLVGENYLDDSFSSAVKGNKKIKMIDPQMDISKFYAIADIVLLPSRVDPFPLSMIEAGLFNKAFIGTNVDGINEFIDNGQDGVLVEPENIEALSTAILNLLANSDYAEDLGNNLNNKVTSYFLIENKVHQYFETYSKL